jgi:hypothetical protein
MGDLLSILMHLDIETIRYEVSSLKMKTEYLGYHLFSLFK